MEPDPRRVHRRPGTGPRPTPTDIAAALHTTSIQLTAGEAAELADTVAALWGRP